MFREFGTLCLAPLVLVGMVSTIRTPSHSSPVESGMIAEFQTCERGLGAHIKASTSGYYALGAQYGASILVGPYMLTISPRTGLSYVDHPNENLPLRTQFEVGAQALVSRRGYHVAVDYWHLSNAGLKRPNVGMDFLSMMVGVSF